MVDRMTETIKEARTMKSVLNRSAMPLFVQVASAIRYRMEVGIWGAGKRIPSLEELAAEFAVSRATARQAVSLLEEEGLLWRKQGKGTFVRERNDNRHWLNLQTEWGSLIQFIQGTTTTLLDSRPGAVLPDLPSEEGRPAPSYQYMHRLHSKKGQAYCVINIFLDSSVFERNAGAFESLPVLAVLDSMPGLCITSAHQILTIGTADVENAHLLDIPINAPVAHVRRIIRDDQGTVMYLGDVIYRADVVKLDIYLR